MAICFLADSLVTLIIWIPLKVKSTRLYQGSKLTLSVLTELFQIASNSPKWFIFHREHIYQSFLEDLCRASSQTLVSNKQESPPRVKLIGAVYVDQWSHSLETEGVALLGLKQVGSVLQRPKDNLVKKSKARLQNVLNIYERLLTKTQGSSCGLSQPRNALMPLIS